MSFSNVLAGTTISLVSSVAAAQISDQVQWESQAVNGQLELGDLVQTTGSFQSNASIHINKLLWLDVAPNTTVHLGGEITSFPNKTPGLSKQGQGALLLSGSNTYRGDTELHQGSLWLGSDQALGSAMSVLDTYMGTRLVYLPGVTISNTLQVLGQHSFEGPPPTGPYADSLQWQVDQGVANHHGTMLFDSKAKVVKQGSGILRLTGNSSQPVGSFQVNQGGLAVDGIFLGSVQVHGGAWLQGQGLLGAASVDPGGVLVNGLGASALRIDRDLTLQPGATYRVDVSVAGAGRPIHVQGQAALAQGLVQARGGEYIEQRLA